ncbi:uncharacterized protein LOC123534450 [Mercenaria mercenaria]|uniref:uncharacterized protein LOC123534450 n=1 Tax=Mercenaria mercenaria TaxID=6596 RepID=UPI00234EFC35|nr:uncharacterized protein LOC123534450 [Mercenaria mercenaria]
MQFRIFVLVCATLVCVAESRLFAFRQRTAKPTLPMPAESSTEENEGPEMPFPTSMPSGPRFPDDSDSEHWPYAMMEFSSLVGRCMTAKFMQKMMRNKPSEGILAEACPHVFHIAKLYAKADDETREKAEEYTRKVYHLLQCVNLQAEREKLEALRNLRGPYKSPIKGNKPENKPGNKPGSGNKPGNKPDNVFFEEADYLFEMCERVFDDAEKSLEDWEARLGKEMESDEDSVENVLRKVYPYLVERRG